MTEDSPSHQSWAISLAGSREYNHFWIHLVSVHAHKRKAYRKHWWQTHNMRKLNSLDSSTQALLFVSRENKKHFLLELMQHCDCWSPDLLHHHFLSTTYFWSHEKSAHFLKVIGGEMVWDCQPPSLITHFNQVCIIQLWKMLHIPVESSWRSWTDCYWPAAGVSSLARSQFRLVHTREKNKVSTQPLNQRAKRDSSQSPSSLLPVYQPAHVSQHNEESKQEVKSLCIFLFCWPSVTAWNTSPKASLALPTLQYISVKSLT